MGMRDVLARTGATFKDIGRVLTAPTCGHDTIAGEDHHVPGCDCEKPEESFGERLARLARTQAVQEAQLARVRALAEDLIASGPGTGRVDALAPASVVARRFLRALDGEPERAGQAPAGEAGAS